jgi:hypothetical protein
MPPIYVPVLSGKEGEYGALQALDLETRRKIMPLIDVPDVPYDWENDRPAKLLEEHVRGVADRIADAWGGEFPFFLDFPLLREVNPAWEDPRPLQGVLSRCQERGLRLIPVVARVSQPSYLSIASAHAVASGHGAALRLFVSDFDDEVDLDTEVDRVLHALRLGPADIDLIVDLEEIKGDVPRTTLIVRSLAPLLPHRADWRRVILAAASFPQDLSELEAESVRNLERVEWSLWRRLQQRPDRMLRPNMLFGDYAIAHPEPREMDPRMMRMSASIRYTTRDSWLIVKGRNVRQWGFDQYYSLCEVLVQQPTYSGPTFSWADQYIAQCAERRVGPGNATTWRKVGTNHHLTLVASQLSNPVEI